jgi:hypothetical protein
MELDARGAMVGRFEGSAKRRRTSHGPDVRKNGFGHNGLRISGCWSGVGMIPISTVRTGA